MHGPNLCRRATQFLPTPSARRATWEAYKLSGILSISTHALREEGDLRPGVDSHRQPDISTHALREEGDCKCAIKQKLFSGSICTIRYSPRKKRAVFVQAALSLERSLHV